jgi:S1-C subfamily serine protease
MIKSVSKLKQYIKPLIKGLVLGAILVGGAYLVLESSQIHHNYIRNKVGPSVVMITNLDKNSGGTGFAIESLSGKKYILTNAHICLGVKRPLVVTFKDRRQVPLRIIEVSSETDLCLIESVGNLPALELGSYLDI